MSKTTKIIAALGVVAGLGVAALPAFTYAAETVSGNVDLFVEVTPAIAMTIVGNNDDGSEHPVDPTYAEVTPEGEENPSEEGWYVEDGGAYIPSVDTTVQSGTTYYEKTYELGSVQVKNPAGATTIAGQNVAGFDIGTTIKHSSSYLSLLPNESGSMISTVTVYTNNASGYTLSLKDADSTTALTLADNSDTITAVAAPAVTSNPGWSVTGGSGENGYFKDGAAITAANQTVKQTATKTTGGDATVMTYTVATRADQSTGVYQDTITYTATTND